MSIIEALRTRVLIAVLALLCSPALAAEVELPEIHSWHTDAGMRVLFIEAPDIPMVSAQLTFAAGAARDDGQPGVARLTANVLMSGTTNRDADELAAALDGYGARVGTGAARDMAWLTLTSLSDDDILWPTIDLLAEVLAEPAFPDDEVERLIGNHRTALQREQQSPGAIASRHFWETAYEGHPYAGNPLGTEDSLDALDAEALRDFHGQYYVARNANLALVGDLDRAAAERLAEALTAGLPAGEAAEEIPSPPELDEDVTIRESYPSSQAHITMGRPGVARGPDDSPALHVANHAFGGGSFTSRLFREVREERGLVYGVRSSSSPMAAAGPYRISLRTRGDQAEEALTVVEDELQRFLADGPTAEETEASVLNITGGFPLSIDANSKLVGYLGVMGFYDLPLDYLERYPDEAAEVDATAAHNALRGVLAERPLVTVIVGGDRARED